MLPLLDLSARRRCHLAASRDATRPPCWILTVFTNSPATSSVHPAMATLLGFSWGLRSGNTASHSPGPANFALRSVVRCTVMGR
ncbi:hypothetical protein O3P69_009140 [Scylla paramamosain]|uniref:Uncharacterized protein n=1 Tax=Scylla paramamosain TaxID=85552 RepID=A0AAW0TA91_SCYPA